MGMTIASIDEFGAAKNLELSLVGTILYPVPLYPQFVGFNSRTEEQFILPPNLPTGKEIEVGFDAFLDYEYESRTWLGNKIEQAVGRLAVMNHYWAYSNEKTGIYLPLARWTLTRTADGVTVSKGMEGDYDYQSHYVDFVFSIKESSSTGTENANISISIKLTPTPDQSGQARIQCICLPGWQFQHWCFKVS